MSVKTRDSRITLPIPGEGETLRRSASRLAAKAIKKWDFKGKAIKPSSLVVALVGSSKTHRSYLRAFLEDKAAEDSGDPTSYLEPDESVVSREELGLIPQRQIFLGEPGDVHWKTEVNMRRLVECSEGVYWKPLPKGAVARIRDEEIPKKQWEEWATDFLQFASELIPLRARRKIASDQEAGEECTSEGKGKKRHQLSPERLDKRLLATAEIMKQSRGNYLLMGSVAIAKGLDIGESTARGFLKQAAEQGWIKKYGETRGATYGLTNAGKGHVQSLSSE